VYLSEKFLQANIKGDERQTICPQTLKAISFQMKTFWLITATIRLSLLVILSIVLISCSAFSADSQQNVTHPAPVSLTPEPLSTNTSTPSVISDILIIS
jgi:hypothetical protein